MNLFLLRAVKNERKIFKGSGVLTVHTVIRDERLPYIQGWLKGLIDQSSDTDSMFRLYRPIQSVIYKFQLKDPVFCFNYP
jgi:hypothetical protein